MKLKEFMNDIRPTEEMVSFYVKRTKKHIDRVGMNMKKLADNSDLSMLLSRIDTHDESKFGADEYEPYIWMTWYYKEDKFKYPNKKIEKSTVEAWKHHESVNSHHPGFHEDILDMGLIDMAEMVCDLAAMSQEFGGDPQEYFDKNVKTKYSFSDNQISNIKGFFDLL